MNVEMLPYGTDQKSPGPQEEAYDMIEACGMKHLVDPKVYMPLIFCVENQTDSTSPEAVIKACVAGADEQLAISTCFGNGKGKEGSSLVKAIKHKTWHLHRRHIPWVIIDGKHSSAAEKNLEKTICKAYTGPNTPAACNKYVQDDNDVAWVNEGSLLSSTVFPKRCQKRDVNADFRAPAGNDTAFIV